MLCLKSKTSVIAKGWWRKEGAKKIKKWVRKLLIVPHLKPRALITKERILREGEVGEAKYAVLEAKHLGSETGKERRNIDSRLIHKNHGEKYKEMDEVHLFQPAWP